MQVIFSFYYNFQVNDWYFYYWFYELFWGGDYLLSCFSARYLSFYYDRAKKNLHAPLDDVGYDPIL